MKKGSFTGISVRGVIFSALFAALLVVLSFVNIHLGFSPVPITLENLIVMLVGGIIGAGYGFLSMLLIVILTALGLPLLHDQGGVGLILGPTGGYVWAWPFCALLTGVFVKRIRGNGVLAYAQILLVTFVFGDLISYVTGVGWLANVAHMHLSAAMVAGCYPFLPGDAIKAVIAAFVVLQVRRVYPISRITGSNRQVVDLYESLDRS